MGYKKLAPVLTLLIVIFAFTSCESRFSKIDREVAEVKQSLSSAMDVTEEFIPEDDQIYELSENTIEAPLSADAEKQGDYNQHAEYKEQHVNLDDGPIILTTQGGHRFFDTFCYGFKLHQYNISTGEYREVFNFSNPYQRNYVLRYTNHRTDDPQQFKFRHMFNSDISKCAVQLTKNGEKHVGWVDYNGTVTDFSELYHPAGTGFSSIAPDDRSPSFTPQGEFFFSDLQNKKYIWVNPDTLEVIKEEKYETAQVLGIKENEVVRDNVFVSYDGLVEDHYMDLHTGENREKIIIHDIVSKDVSYGVLQIGRGYADHIDYVVIIPMR